MRRILTKSLIIKVLALGSIFAFVIAGGVYAYETLWSGKVHITVSSPTAGINWNCPIGGQALIAPYPVNGRPLLTASTPCCGITVSAVVLNCGVFTTWMKLLGLGFTTFLALLAVR